MGKKIIISIVCIIIIICLFVLGFYFFGNNKIGDSKDVKLPNELQEEINNVIVADENSFSKVERFNNEMSDIEGVSKREKLEMGLNSEDNSDTDNDGLTDKEEIEVYKSDPLNSSTSGDGIPDGFKVSNNLKINEKYDINELGLENEIDKSVHFEEEKNKENKNSIYYQIDGYSVDGYEVIKAYGIDAYIGKVTIDFSNYISNYDTYFIYKKSNNIGSDYELLNDKSGVVSFDVTDGGCVVVAVENEIYQKPVTVTNAYTGEEMTLDEIGEVIIEEPLVMSEEDLGEDSTVANTISTSYDTIKYGNYDLFVQGAHTLYKFVIGKIDNIAEKGKLYVKGIGSWLKEQESKGKNSGVKPSKYMSSFDVRVDALPFYNLGTYISQGGNCSGFSLITMQLFNNRLYEKKGGPMESNFMDAKNPIYYDISSRDFETFFNPYLKDYKYRTYWQNTYDSEKMLTMKPNEYKGTDGEFIAFLGYKWVEYNKNTDVEYMNTNYKWSKFEDLKKYFEAENQICNIDMFYNGSGHSIIGYGLRQDEDNPNVWYIMVYDNNIPGGCLLDGTMTENYIKITKHEKKILGFIDNSYFTYEYRPYAKVAPDRDYYFKSEIRYKDGKACYFCIDGYDEKFNKIF